MKFNLLRSLFKKTFLVSMVVASSAGLATKAQADAILHAFDWTYSNVGSKAVEIKTWATKRFW